MAYREKQVAQGSMHRRLKERGMELQEAPKLDKAKPSWAVKSSEGRERTSSVEGRERSTTKSGRERSSTGHHRSSSQHERHSEHNRHHHHHHRDDDDDKRHHRRASRRSSTRESSAEDGRRGSVRQSVDKRQRARSTSSRQDSKNLKSWEESLKENEKVRSRKKSTVTRKMSKIDDSDDSDDDFRTENKKETKANDAFDLNKWANFAKDDGGYKTSTGKAKGTKNIELMLSSASPGQVRQFHWAAGVIQKAFRLNSRSLRVRRRLCGNRSYKGDRGQNLLVLYGWLQKKSRFGWEFKYCYVDPRDGYFKYAPRDIHNGTLPPGKRSVEPSSFTQLRWNLNGKYGVGGFDLHIVLPAEPKENDPRSFYFVSHHKDVILRAGSEEEANHWVDQVHEWVYCFLHEKDHKAKK